MKKITTLLLAVLMILSSITVSAQDNVSAAAHRLAQFELIDANNLEADVTRASAVSAVIKLITGNTSFDGIFENVFEDVTADNAAAGHIYYAYNMGYVSGIDATHFAPDATVTLNQFAKIATSALGYRVVAEAEGGYATGYYAVASRIGLLKGTDIQADSTLKVADMLLLLNNMLDARTLEKVIGSQTDEWQQSELTLYDQLKNRFDLVEFSGDVRAVGPYHTELGEALDADRINVGGMEFVCNADYALSLLGKDVEVIAKKLSGNKYEIVSIYETEENEELTILAKDIADFSSSSMTYFDAEKLRDETVSFANTQLIYNGTYVSKEDVTFPKTGSVRLLDNNGGGSYEYAFIDEYESFIIDRISANNFSLYFKDNATYRGKSGFWFDFNDDEKYYTLVDENGSEIEFSALEIGTVVSIAANADETIITVTASKKTVQGQIDEISTINNAIIIDGESYSVYLPNVSKIFGEYLPGQSGAFALNHNGEIVGAATEWTTDGEYGYVTGITKLNGFNAPKLRVVSAASSEKRVEVEGDEETIIYTYHNGDEKVYEIADSLTVSVNGSANQKISAGELSESMLTRGAIYYRLDSKGKIKHLKINTVPVKEAIESDYSFHFNGELNSFGKHATIPAFQIGSVTNVICIPVNNSPSSDDYFEEVEIIDESYYPVFPIEFDEEDQTVECAVLVVPMDSATPKPIKSTTKISIVGEKTEVFDENGDILYKLETLTGSTLKNPFLRQGSSKDSIVENLGCGDLIRYTTKGTGEISNVEYLESMSLLPDSYFNDKAMSASEVVYGRADSIELFRLDDNLNERVDKLSLYYGDPDEYDGTSLIRKYSIHCEDGPPVYIYSRRNGAIKVGSTDDISSYDRVGDGASDVFMFVNENNPQVVVIITD